MSLYGFQRNLKEGIEKEWYLEERIRYFCRLVDQTFGAIISYTLV